ncbi:MAG: hypothetical protein QNJ14_08900 [Woeseiaceae bacterium]|nr:hypothetical protein [Woeseiaceae bacterium]
MNATITRLTLLTPAVLIVGCGQGDVSYSRDIQPVFDNYCVSCHAGTGEGAETSEYLMTDYENVMTGTKYGPVVVAGSRMSSALYLVVAGKTAPEIRMPPHNEESFAEGRGFALSPEAIEKIGVWIDLGARNN